MNSPRPETVIKSFAPVRICDNGGWTDTWFAEHGEVFNIAVAPYVKVEIVVQDADQVEDRIIIHAVNFDDHYIFDPNIHSSEKGWQKHPLLEATIQYMNLPNDKAFDIRISSAIPIGASTGTSAAVTVALIAGLDTCTTGRLKPGEIAQSAQLIETEFLGQQCGIQDQICSAYGGINFIKMEKYPHATVIPIQPPNHLLSQLEQRLSLVYLGKSHSSSETHDLVIRRLETSGPETFELENLRKTASASRKALISGDFNAFGQAMIDNNEAQKSLHPALISDDANQVIEIARAYNAVGWKVNGAGGEGGSITLLSSRRFDEKNAMISAIEQENPNVHSIPIRISMQGVRALSNN
jgi:D-glycero-alpha-D-manno-heptose-7-phosphate kinase